MRFGPLLSLLADERRARQIGITTVASLGALDGTRIVHGKTWKEVAAETEVSESTLSRMRTGQRPDAGSLASLAAWSGLNPADFVVGSRPMAAEPLAQISAFLHSDPRLSKEGADMIAGLVKFTYERIAKKR